MIADQVQHTVRVGWLTAVPDETGAVQRLQARWTPFETTDGVNSMGLYGVASCPLEGAAVLAVNINGNNSNGTIIATNDGRHRPTGMLPGELMLYTNMAQQIYLSQTGGTISIVIKGGQQVNVIASDSVTVTAPLVTIKGSVTITGDITVDGSMTVLGDTHAGTVSLERHVHSNAGGTGTSGPPVA